MRYVITCLLLLPLTACGLDLETLPDSAYLQPSPERLLDRSHEVRRFELSAPGGSDKAMAAINSSSPNAASLYCNAKVVGCKELQKRLQFKGIPTRVVGSGANAVELVYDRITARDCDPRYRNDVRDYHVTIAPEYGCAVTSNMLQHVSDRAQFTHPKTMENPPASDAVSSYLNAVDMRIQSQQASEKYSVDESTAGGSGE
jgi:hypothetical protein